MVENDGVIYQDGDDRWSADEKRLARNLIDPAIKPNQYDKLAEASGLSVSQVLSLLSNPEFLQYTRKIAEDFLYNGGAVIEAIRSIRQSLGSGNSQAQANVLKALGILVEKRVNVNADVSPSSKTTSDLDAKIAELEAQISPKNGSGGG